MFDLPTFTSGEIVNPDTSFSRWYFNGTTGVIRLSDGSEVVIGSGGAADTEAFVTIGNTAGLSAERALTGTTNEIVITDNGANSTVVLSFASQPAISDFTNATHTHTDASQGGLINFQQIYDNTGATQPKFTVDATNSTFTIRNAATPLTSLFTLEDNSGTDFFAVGAGQLDYGIASNREYEITTDPTGRATIQYLPDGRTFTTSPTGGAALTWSSTCVSNIPGGAPFGNDTAPAMVQAIGECQFDSPGLIFATSLLFNQASVLSANGVNLGPIYSMVNQPTVRSISAGTRTCSQANAVRSQHKVGPNTAGNIVQTSHEPFFATIIIDATVGSASATTVNYFAPKAPTLTAGGTIGTLNCMDIPAIPSSGISTLRGINSAMSAGTFINHTGTAPSAFAGDIRVNNAVDVFFGSSGSNGAFLQRSAAGTLRMGGQGGTFNESLDWDFDSASNNVSITSPTGASLNFDTSEIAFGPSTVADGTNNWVFAFSPGLRGTNLAGDYAEVLFSSSSAIAVAHALSNFATWMVNAPTISITGGSIVNAANVIIQTSMNQGTNRYGLLCTSNPSGGTLNYCARFTGATGVRIDGLFEHTGSTWGIFGSTPTTQPPAYTPTNVTTDRAYDANATTINEMADVLGTLIADLQSLGVIG